MLWKLIKYEMRSTSRIMWFLYAAVLVLGLVIGILLRIAVNTGKLEMDYVSFSTEAFGPVVLLLSVLIIVYVLLIFAMAVMTLIMIIQRFTNNLLKEEGYLMHTLPVPTWMLVLSKLVIAAVWMAIGVITSFLSVLLLGASSGMLGYVMENGGSRMIKDLLAEKFVQDYAGVYIISVIVGAIALILLFYLSIAIGNMANKNKSLLAVVSFIGIVIVISFVSSVAGGISAEMIAETAEASVEQFENSIMYYTVRSIIVDVVLGALFFAGTTLILKKRLNLA